MTLPVASNAISMSQVNTELGLGSTAPISLNDAAVRSLFGKSSGAISMSDGWGKSSIAVVNPLSAGSVYADDGTGGSVKSVFVFRNNGTIGYYMAMIDGLGNITSYVAPVSWSGPTAWHQAPAAGVGNSAWINGLSLASDRYFYSPWAFQEIGSVSSTFNFSITSDSAGANVLVASNGWVASAWS